MTPPKRSRHPLTRFLSTTFNQPVGQRIAVDEAQPLRGYYIDLSSKALRPDWPAAWPFTPGEASFIALAQVGLGAFERFLRGDGEEWLGLARTIADVLREHQVEGGARDGALEHRFDLAHTYVLTAPWISAMAQGEAASLLVRVHAETGEERYADAALRALGPMHKPVSERGTMGQLGGGPFPQEFPTDPPAHVLNGGIFAIWGLYDVARALGDDTAREAFDATVTTLSANLERWDTGRWSRYDLYPHRLTNPASFAYHRLHIDQLRATALIAPRTRFTEMADRFEAYADQGANRVRAFARKVAFRVLVPRDARLARRLPWAR